MTPPATIAVSPYAFPERALRRWVRENLAITPRVDGGADAVFRFEGSTCSNVTFHLLYRVSCASASASHRIESMRCEPAPHDEGHARMCCWQENAAAVIATMSGEAPLLGRPLGAVLAWRPDRSPAGCLCVRPSRHHKWQAVLETVHFALGHAAASPLSHENRTRA